MSHARDSKVVPVYRRFQFIWESPCRLANPCSGCRMYYEQTRRSDRHFPRFGECVCKRARPAAAAFHVTRRQGLSLVYAELAEFVHAGDALRLTFSVVPNLRDQSSRADEELIFEFLAGSERARIAIYEAWKNPPPAIFKPSLLLPIYPFV